MATSYSANKAMYETQFAAATITAKFANEAVTAAKQAIANKAKIDPVAAKFGVPWFVIAVIMMRESGGSFAKHLHNGDPLSARTVREPAGRPRTGSPPFTWEQSAEDALYQKLKEPRENSWATSGCPGWSIPETLYKLQAYNGLADRPLCNPSNIAYMWSGTQYYKGGKYVTDRVFNPSAIDSQLGCVAMIKALIQLGAIDAKSFGPGANIGTLTTAEGGFQDGGSGGSTTISQMNPQLLQECINNAFGLNLRARAQNRNLEAMLNVAAEPNLLDLEPQTTFEFTGMDKDLTGTFTVEDVLFRFDGNLTAKITAYSPDPNAPPPELNTTGTTPATPGATPTSGPINDRIAKAAEASRGASSRSGPGGGNIACAWCVNNLVLAKAGIKPIGNDSVAAVEADLLKGRGKLVEPRTQAQAGDILIMGSQHIGIVTGPNKCLSNSSTKAAFIWEASFEAYDRYYKVTCKAYRVTS